VALSVAGPAADGNGGSSLAFWFLVALGGVGTLLVAGAAFPTKALASPRLRGTIAPHRVDVALSGAIMISCLLILLALGR
jgi:hypothetical protein